MTNTRRFEFGPCLGRGSFGEVYACSMRSPGGLETTVAVKLLRSDLDLQGDAVRRLRDEGRLLARLNHPAIVKVYDLVTLRGRLALITELVDGADVATLLGELPVRPMLQAMGQVAAALHAAYASPGPEGPLRLVHRDVKPSNTRVEKHGQAKLLDFGIARFDASDREVRTASDMVVGSVPYMAPERFIERAVLPSSDVFSVGCTLYEGICGERFYGSNQVAKVTGLALHPERYALMLREQLDSLEVADEVRVLLASLLAHDPLARPTAKETSERLEELADNTSGPTLRMWCRDHTWRAPEPMNGPLEGQVLEEGELDDFTPVPTRRAPVIHSSAPETSGFAPVEPEVNPTLAPPTEDLVRLAPEEDGSTFEEALLLPPSQRPTILTSEPSEQETQQRKRPPVSIVEKQVVDEASAVVWVRLAIVLLFIASVIIGVIALLVAVPGILLALYA